MNINETLTPSRIAGLKQFAAYAGFAPMTLYIKLAKGQKFPGAFKIPGSKLWKFNLDIWDSYVSDLIEEQK